jgi:uncharacterized RDD family membrane protein YckC
MQPTNVVGRRVAAVIIDYVLLLAFNAAVFFAMAKKDEEILEEIESLDDTLYGNFEIGDSQYSIVGDDFLIYLLITVGVGILYWMVLPGLRGWTVGKLALGIRVVRADGTLPAGVGKNIVRQLLWIVDNFPYVIPALTGFIVALTNDQNRRVGDIVAGTLVVRASAVGQPVTAGTPAAVTAGQPGFPPVQPGAQPAQPGAQPAQPGAQPAQPGAQPAASRSSSPAGWYADPTGQKRLRYWDGSRWTENTAD